MILKRILLLVAFVWGSAAAQAATLDTVTVPVGAATMSGSGTFGAGGGVATFTSSSADIDASMDPVFITISTIGAPSNFLAQTFGIVPPLPFPVPGPAVLTGDLIEFSDANGVFLALFETTGMPAVSGFGSFFRVTIQGMFSDGVVDETGFAQTNASILVEAVNAPNPVPLPAGVWLILAGMGSFAVVRRRAQS